MTAAASEPLRGLRVWLTRAEPELARSVEVWARAGASVLAAPTVEVRPRRPSDEEIRAVAAAVERAGDALVVALPSPRAAMHFFDAFATADHRGRSWSIAAIGEATAERARVRGIEPRLVARRALGADLAAQIVRELGPRAVLLPSSDVRRPELGESLRDAGVDVVDLVVHRTEPVRVLPEVAREALAGGAIDLVAAYSPSAIEFVGVIDSGDREAVQGLPLAALGPTTADRARSLGLRVVASPARPGEGALVDDVGRWWRRTRTDRASR